MLNKINYIIFFLLILLTHSETLNGICGDTLTWTYDTTSKSITITGSGMMYDEQRQWDSFRSEIQYIQFNGEITSIGKGAFHNSQITTFSIPSSVTIIKERAFENCKQLKQVVVPVINTSKLTTILSKAFANCPLLTSFSIPPKVTTFNRNVFEGTNIETIKVYGNNEAFEVENNVLYNKGKTSIIYYPKNNTNTHFIIPSTVQTIEKRAFISTKLQTISFLSSLTTIGEKSFYGNEYLKRLFIPKNVKIIKRYAFAFNDHLEELIIESDEITIEEGAFFGCTGLQRFVFSGSKITIGEKAFTNSQITEVETTWKITEENLSNGLKVTKSIVSGSCGDNCFYELNRISSIMNIHGTGEIVSLDGLISSDASYADEIIIR